MAADLPPPDSGLPLETAFRRLLSRCEEIAGGDAKGRDDLEEWATSPVFHANVEALQEHMDDLDSIARNRIPADTLQAYKQHVDALAARLRPVSVPSYCLPQQRAQPSGQAPPAAARPPAQPPAQPSTAGPQQPPHQREAGVGTAELRNRKGLAGPLHQTTQDELDRNRNLQESLTDEMLALSAALKRNARAMQQAVGRREGLLDTTEDAIEESLAKAKRSAKDSKSLKVRGSIGFCAILMAVFFVAAVFLGTYVFIKTTSFVGYRAPRRP